MSTQAATAIGKRTQIAVVGGAKCSQEDGSSAFEVGRLLAERHVILLCGGRGGAMEHAAAGARAADGLTVGVLPGRSPAESASNPYLEVELHTGLGQGRNLILVLSSAAVIAVGGGWGTLSEIALALKHEIPVVSLGGWRPELPSGRREPLFRVVETPEEAVELALSLGRKKQAGVGSGGRR